MISARFENGNHLKKSATHTGKVRKNAAYDAVAAVPEIRKLRDVRRDPPRFVAREHDWLSWFGLSQRRPVAEPPHFQKISTHEKKIAFAAKQTAPK